ncbi:MAG: hypothetical protein HQL10_05620 [Nitrospirae bacterium]|nr:hypothetical protein [Nitrospirota bacterium]
MQNDAANKCVTVISDQGPSVNIESPELTRECKPPVKVVARFIPNNGKDVDLSTLKVEMLKFISIDLTSKVMPYATTEGIFAEDLPLPSGNHKIRLSIGDTGGGVTRLQFEIKVA